MHQYIANLHKFVDCQADLSIHRSSKTNFGKQTLIPTYSDSLRSREQLSHRVGQDFGLILSRQSDQVS